MVVFSPRRASRAGSEIGIISSPRAYIIQWKSIPGCQEFFFLQDSFSPLINIMAAEEHEKYFFRNSFFLSGFFPFRTFFQIPSVQEKYKMFIMRQPVVAVLETPLDEFRQEVAVVTFLTRHPPPPTTHHPPKCQKCQKVGSWKIFWSRFRNRKI